MTFQNNFSLRDYDEACKQLKRLAEINRGVKEPFDKNHEEKREPTIQDNDVQSHKESPRITDPKRSYKERTNEAIQRFSYEHNNIVLMETGMKKSIRTSGLRPGRENALVDEIERISRCRHNNFNDIRDTIIKLQEEAKILREEYTYRESALLDKIQTNENKYKEELERQDKLAKKMLKNTEEKLQKQIEEMKRSEEFIRERAEEEANRTVLRKFEDQMLRDLERTKARLARASEAEIAELRNRFDSEKQKLMDSRTYEFEALESREAEAQTKLETMRKERDDLAQSLVVCKHTIWEMEEAIRTLKQQVNVQRKHESHTKKSLLELETSCKDLLDRHRQVEEEQRTMYEARIQAINRERDAQLEELDCRIRKGMVVKDQIINKLRTEVASSKKNAEEAKAALLSIEEGFRAVS